VIITGTQLVDDVPTSEHVDVVIVTNGSTLGGKIISVDTTVETLYVETREVPKSVAVGVGWHAMRNYFVNFKRRPGQCMYGVAVVEANGGDVCA